MHKNKYIYSIMFCCGAIVLLLIIRPWNLYFLNDDFEHIPMQSNKLILRNHFLRPVANFFLFTDYHLYGKEATGYFFTSFFLHLVCVAGIYLVSSEGVRKFLAGVDYKQTGIFCSLLFLLYPFHAEPLCWILTRGSIIAAALCTFSIYFYLKKNESRKYFYISLLLFVYALFTYESVWNAPLIYILIGWFSQKNTNFKKREFYDAAIMCAAFALYLVIRYTMLGTLTGGYYEFDSNIKNVPLLLTNLVKLTARNFTPPFQSDTALVIFFLVSMCIYITLIIRTFKKRRLTGGFLMVLLSLIITSLITFCPLGIDTHTNESSRYIYFSSFFYCFFLSVVIISLAKTEGLQWFIVSSVLLIFSLLLFIYRSDYQHASAITRTTANSISGITDHKKIFFIDVPDQYDGAVIFRTGLPYAVKWFCADCDENTVQILSKENSLSAKLPYTKKEVAFDSLAAYKNWQKLPLNSGLDSSGNIIQFDNSSFILWYRDDGLYKVILP